MSLDLRWYPYRVPLPGRFTSAHEVLETRTGIMLEVEAAPGVVGIGECAPLPEFSGGTLEEATQALPSVVQLIRPKTLAAALALLEGSHEGIPAVLLCGLEAALLDALGQSVGCPIAFLLAAQKPVRKTVAVNAVLGSQSLTTVVAQAQEAVRAGFTCVKLKLVRDTDASIALVEAVRTALGPATHLRLDANESWDFAQARTILQSCERFDIQYVEQPLARHDLSGMAALRHQTVIPLAADEMLSDLASARRVLSAQAADVLVVKPQLAGGLRLGRQIIQEATASGLRCVVTSTIEAGIGVCGALQLAAAATEIDLECGLATLSLLADDLIIDDLPVLHGHMVVPTDNGLGVRLDRAALQIYRG